MLISDAPDMAQPAIVVVGTREAAQMTPNTSVAITQRRLRETVSVRNAEDSLRYFPSLLVRKRHVGDTQAPLATRTSGVGSSARSLVYADGILLSALIGNNNNFASPRWGMVSPEEIERVDVLYGPFSAAYPGNSVGAVVNITTRMPDKLEASATLAGNLQQFSQYRTNDRFRVGQFAATMGDRSGPLAWFLSANHVDSHGQPLAFITVARPSSAATAGTPVSGAIDSVSRTGAPIFVVGAGGFERQRQDNLKAKLTLDLPDRMKFSWQSALFLNRTHSDAQTYLRDSSGTPVFAGPVNIEGRTVTIPASAFSNQVYAFDERHWMHSAKLEQAGDRIFWSLAGSIYRFGKSEQRIPSTALPGANQTGAGSIVRMNGTGWRNLDLHGYTRSFANQELHAGAHADLFTLVNQRFATPDWQNGAPTSLAQESLGHTRTLALWAEDHLTVTPSLMLTLGARYEWWRAWRGRIFSTAPMLNVNQPPRTAQGLSPKASLNWSPSGPWSATLSYGRALRFPTVSELYQSTSVGNNIESPNPDLRPEKANSGELAIERRIGTGSTVRLSLFHEVIDDALISQTAPLPGQTVLFSYVQNIGRTRTNGAELVVDKRNLLHRLDVSGSFTIADPKIVSDPLFAAAQGKLIPQVPRRRATLVATWRPNDKLSLTAAARYSSRLYGTIDNSDVVGHAWQGFEGYFVVDVRAQYRLSHHWSVAAGVENLTNRRYFLFHPFPGRTVTAELSWHL